MVCLLNSIRRGLQGQGPWSMESPENHPKGSLVVSFLFLLEPKGDPAQRSAFGKEEGGCEYGAFAAPAEAEWSRLLLTLRRFFSFSEKRKKRMGAQKRGRAMPAPTASILARWKIESQQSLRHGCAVPPPFTQGRHPLRRAEKGRPHRGRLSEQGHLVIFRQVAKGACGFEVFDVGL